MESSMERGDHPPESDSLPSEEGQLASPPLLQRPSTAKRRRYPFATKKGALVVGVTLLIAIILGARFLAPHIGPHPTWTFQLGDDASVYVSPLVINGTVYVIDELSIYDNILFALNARSGSVQWSFRVEGSIFQQPFVTDGMVYALDGGSGSKRWSYQTAGDIALAPVVADGLVYVVSHQTLYAIQPFS